MSNKNKTEEILIRSVKVIAFAIISIFTGKKVKQHFNNNNNQHSA